MEIVGKLIFLSGPWLKILDFNVILSIFIFVPNGYLNSVSCRNTRWIIIIAVTMRGEMKWNLKNPVRVALSTAKPPQIHWTNTFSRYGTPDTRLVITVAPQKDICPHGKTWPRKDVIITKMKISTHRFHVFLSYMIQNRCFGRYVHNDNRKILMLDYHGLFRLINNSLRNIRHGIYL